MFLNNAETENTADNAAVNEVVQLELSALATNPYQPRKEFDSESLEELASSIKAQGVIQPIVVRQNSESKYEVIAGERRWRASKLAGLTTIPAIVKQIPNQSALAIALIENIQREDLNPLEQSRALKQLADEFDLTHADLAEAVGKSRASVTNLLRLLNLNEDVKILLQHGDIELGHAKLLLTLPENMQQSVARTIVTKDLTVREAEDFIRKIKLNPQAQATKTIATPQDPNIQALQNNLSERLAAKVIINSNPKGKGKLTISFNSLDELDGILEHIN